jgi:hypothetical protein
MIFFSFFFQNTRKTNRLNKNNVQDSTMSTSIGSTKVETETANTKTSTIKGNLIFQEKLLTTLQNGEKSLKRLNR